MRGFVFLLVLANLLFFAWAQGYFGTSETPDSDRIAQQLNPEKLRIVGRGDMPPAVAESTPPASAVAESVAESCLSWANLGVVDAEALAAEIAQKSPAARVERQDGVLHSSWWAFMAQKTRVDAERKAAELKAIGVNDFFVVQEAGPFRWAISLGVFSSEATANSALEALRAKGVRSARVGPKGEARPVVTLNVHAPTSEIAALQALSPGLQSTECAPPPNAAPPPAAAPPAPGQ